MEAPSKDKDKDKDKDNVQTQQNSTAKRTFWLVSVKKWIFELSIVFLGVYAAFEFSEHQRQREADVHREQIQQALVREIEEITFRTRRAAAQFPRVIAYYDSTISSGAMPSLQPMVEPINVRAHMWEAALQSGGLSLLDVPTLYRISEFYNALNAGFEQLAQLRQLSEDILIPNLDGGVEEFYDPQTKRLRSKYAWYLEGMGRAADLAEGITKLGDTLVGDLKATGTRVESPLER